MRIALLHYAAPPIVGGVERVLAAHANLLADAGHRALVIAARGEAWRADVPFAHLPLVDSRHPAILQAKQALDRGTVPADFALLRDQIADRLAYLLRGFDVLIAHNVVSLHKNLPLTAALHDLSQRPDAPALVLWHHDLAWTTPRYRAELHDGFPWDLLRVDWPWAAQVAVSELRRAELTALLGVPAARVHVIPNGVDLAAFFKLEQATQRILARLPLLDAAPLLLLPVRLTPRKNVELALRITAALRRSMPAATLVVTGPLGPHNPANAAYFERLRNLRAELGLEGAAFFLAELTAELPAHLLDGDALPDGVIADFYRLADALLFPSREEGFGIPLLEAGLSRVPVFCSDIPPLRALGGDDVTYLTPDAGPDPEADPDPEAAARLVQTRLEASAEYRLALRARRYTWSAIYANWLAPLLDEAARSAQERRALAVPEGEPRAA